MLFKLWWWLKLLFSLLVFESCWWSSIFSISRFSTSLLRADEFALGPCRANAEVWEMCDGSCSPQMLVVIVACSVLLL
jgi:hypothetical protein